MNVTDAMRCPDEGLARRARLLYRQVFGTRQDMCEKLEVHPHVPAPAHVMEASRHEPRSAEVTQALCACYMLPETSQQSAAEVAQGVLKAAEIACKCVRAYIPQSQAL